MCIRDREHAALYQINPAKIFVVGFSAGGHLAGMLGTLWHLPIIRETLQIESEICRPTGMILCYPVITGSEKRHKGSFCNLIGAANPDKEDLQRLSLENCVDKNTCPAFLMHTASDPLVPVENSLYMAQALAAHGIFFEMHIYPEGPHGMALANDITNIGSGLFSDTSVAAWLSQSVRWMDRI